MFPETTKSTKLPTPNDDGLITPTRDNIVAIARAFVGTPWLHQGRGFHGVDCVGVIIKIGHLTGTTNYDTTANYRRFPRPEVFLQHFREELSEKPITQRKHGDVLLLRDSIFTTHCGIFCTDPREGDTFIHAFANRRKVLEEPITPGPEGHELYSRITHCFEYRGVLD
jgi:cell wall-associated NlpC family hydrolase